MWWRPGVSISPGLGSVPGRDTPDGRTHRQTDRQTDRIPIANTRSQQYLPVQLSRVKIDRLKFRGGRCALSRRYCTLCTAVTWVRLIAVLWSAVQRNVMRGHVKPFSFRERGFAHWPPPGALHRGPPLGLGPHTRIIGSRSPNPKSKLRPRAYSTKMLKS